MVLGSDDIGKLEVKVGFGGLAAAVSV